MAAADVESEREVDASGHKNAKSKNYDEHNEDVEYEVAFFFRWLFF
jgi:hypothetical protein